LQLPLFVTPAQIDQVRSAPHFAVLSGEQDDLINGLAERAVASRSEIPAFAGMTIWIDGGVPPDFGA